MENTRELIKIVEARNSQMLTIMHQYTNYVILILAGVWTIFANGYLTNLSKLPKKYEPPISNDVISNFFVEKILLDPIFGLIITLIITIVILIIWRFYIHQIDNDIVQNYQKIILFEKRLYGNPDEIPETSALYNLIQRLIHICPHLDEKLIKYNKINYDQKTDLVFKLIDKNLIGYRGQQIFDIVSGVFIIQFSIFIFCLFNFKNNFHADPILLLGICILSLFFILIGLILIFGSNILSPIIPSIQKDPNCAEVEEILKGINDEKTQQGKKIDKIAVFSIIVIILCIGIFLSMGYFFGYNNGYYDAQKADVQNLNEFFHNQYYYHIKDEGRATIDDIVNKTDKNGTYIARLNQIADQITKDFSDPFWVDMIEIDGQAHWKKYFYGNTSGTSYKQFINKSLVMPQYWFEKRGKVRLDYIADDSIFWDPDWIAYQKTGACQELSILFNATANKAGFESRIVRSDGAYDTGHFWNEVNISGEWKFFDVQQYGIKKNTNNSSYWYGNTSDYSKINFECESCDVTKYGVYVLDLQNGGYGKDITDSYDPQKLCPHGTRRN